MKAFEGEMNLLLVGFLLTVVLPGKISEAYLDPCDHGILSLSCTPGERLANPDNCRGYYECESALLGLLPFSWSEKQCTSGLKYNYTAEKCQSGDDSMCFDNCPAEVELDLTQKPTDKSLVEGQRVQFICSFRYLRILSRIKVQRFRWYLNNDEIWPNGRRIGVDTNRNFNRFNSTNSTLTFQTVSPSDSGLVRCVVEYTVRLNLVISRDLFMQVSALPIVSIDPLALDVFASEDFSISCVVTNFDPQNGIRITFSWFQDGQLNSSYDSQLLKTTKQWSVSSNISSVVIGCSAKIDQGTSLRQTASINVLKDNDEVCPMQYNSDRSVAWPQTRIGNNVSQPCPDDYTGVCSRVCGRNVSGSPSWSAPDCNLCVNKKLKEVSDKLRRLEDGIGLSNKEEFADIARSLSNLTNDTNGLRSAELELTVDAVDRMARLRKEHDALPNRDEITSVVKTMSNILQPSNGPTLNLLTQNNKTVASKLLSSADAYGRSLSHVVNETDNSEVTDYIVLEVNSWKPDNLPSQITFPLTEKKYWNEDRIDRISIPITAFDSDKWRGNSSLSVWSIYYRNIDDYFPSISDSFLNSRVLSLTVENLTDGEILKQPVSIILQHDTVADKKYSGKCVFWKFISEDEGTWSDEGCTVVTSNSTRTVCSCNHLTNFAILMSLNPSSDAVLSLISTIGCSISTAALILTVIIYALTWSQAKSHQAVVLINLCVALIIANIIFLAGSDKVDPKDGCTAVAVLLHYFFLAAFFLMLADGIQLFIYVVFVLHAKRTLETAMLIVGAWVLPLIIVTISLGATKTLGYGNEKSCWLSIQNNLIWAFIGPALFIVAINIVIIVIVLVRISTTKLASSKKNKSKIRGMMWNIAVICPVLGISWLFGVLSVSFDIVAFQYIFAIANTLQGLFIFVFHSLFYNRRINERLSSFVSQYVTSKSDKSQKTGVIDGNKAEKAKMAIQGNCYKELHNQSFSGSVGKYTASMDSSTTFSCVSTDNMTSDGVSVSNSVTAEIDSTAVTQMDQHKDTKQLVANQ